MSKTSTVAAVPPAVAQVRLNESVPQRDVLNPVTQPSINKNPPKPIPAPSVHGGKLRTANYDRLYQYHTNWGSGYKIDEPRQKFDRSSRSVARNFKLHPAKTPSSMNLVDERESIAKTKTKMEELYGLRTAPFETSPTWVPRAGVVPKNSGIFRAGLNAEKSMEYLRNAVLARPESSRKTPVCNDEGFDRPVINVHTPAL